MSDLNELEIRKLVEEAVQQLGKTADGATVNQVVQEAVQKIEPSQPTSSVQGPSLARDRIIVTAFGKNRQGILAGLTTVLAENNCDIIDLNQKILQEFFTTMLLVDISAVRVSFDELKQKIVAKGDELDLKVIIQHEEYHAQGLICQ